MSNNNVISGSGVDNEGQVVNEGKNNDALSFVEDDSVSSQQSVCLQSNPPLLSSQNLVNLEDRICQVIEQAISKHNQVQVPVYRQSNSGFEKDVIAYLKCLYEGISYKSEDNNATYYVKYKLFQNQNSSSQKLDSIVKDIQSLQQTIESQSKIIAEQSSIIKKQHERIIQYENDMMYKAQKDLIMELIGIADQLKFTLSDYADQNDYEALYSSVKDMREWVDGSLQTVGVRKYENIVSAELDKKRQEVSEIQDTDNEDEEGMFKSILPGYVWTIPMVSNDDKQEKAVGPRKYEFIIRPEQVARLRFKPMEKALKQDNLTTDVMDNSAGINCVDEVSSLVEEKKSRDSYSGTTDKTDKKDTSFWNRIRNK